MLSQVLKETNDYTYPSGVKKCILLKCPCGTEFVKLKTNVRDNTVCVECSMKRRNDKPTNRYTTELKKKVERLSNLLACSREYLPDNLKLEVLEELQKDINSVFLNPISVPTESVRPDNTSVPTVDGTETEMPSDGVRAPV